MQKPLRPYLYKAYYDWIVDNNTRPYLMVNALYPNVDVPMEFVNEGRIVLNLSPLSIGNYEVDDEGIRFNARFQGMLRDIYIPFGAVEALFAQENSQGVMFEEEDYYSEKEYLARINQTTETKEPKKKKAQFSIVE